MIERNRLLYAVPLAVLFLISDSSFLSPRSRQANTILLEPPRAYGPKKEKPPLNTLLSNIDTEEGIKNEVSHLLDIAILGHAKCATTFVLKWLNKHKDIDLFPHEVCDLYELKPARLVRRLYLELSENKQRGFKCPGHFSSTPMRYFQNFFPKAKLIVGLRHPVQYFESFYNFRNRHLRLNVTLPPAETLSGQCTLEAQGVCTHNAKFHVNLARLGKTIWSDPEEQKLLNSLPTYRDENVSVPNRLFLYDVTQLYDRNFTRLDQFADDLSEFLGLSTPLDRLGRDVVKPRKKPKMITLNICDDKYGELRTELMAIGKRASIWIRKFLLQSESVVVSNSAHFESILRTWKYDPCEYPSR